MEATIADEFFEHDPSLPPFRIGLQEDMFGEIDEGVERLAALVMWAGATQHRVARLHAWVESWNPSCALYMIAITYNEWFYLFEPRCMNRLAWNTDRFVAHGTVLRNNRVNQLRIVVAFLLTFPAYAASLGCVHQWLLDGKRSANT